MNISFETEYNQKAMTTMARALRKTIRKKKSRRSHILGWFVVALALIFSCWSADSGFSIKLEIRTIITAIIIVVLVAVLIWEDVINGYFARRRLLPGTEKASVVFGETEFVSSTDIGTSTFYYDKIEIIAESTDYFVFIFSISHAQVYDKKNISGGTLQEFRDFMEQVTGKHIVRI
jgi:hypothetical protein